MHDIKGRRRIVIICIIITLLILLFLHSRTTGPCEGPEFLQKLWIEEERNTQPKIYAISPTFARPTQKAELTRLSHLFMLIPNLHWILIEDANTTSKLVNNIIKRAGLEKRAVQLNVNTAPAYKLSKKDPNWIKPRGVEQRNMALSWLRTHVDPQPHSIVFFMDDDNSYSVELFMEMMKIERGRVGIWPVGLVGGLMVEKPYLNENSKIVGFNAAWRPERPFPIDMAAFAVSADLLFKYPEALFSYEVQRV